jgi:hypothetical protein
MSSNLSLTLVAALVIGWASLALSGCGRRGDLPLDQDLARRSLATAMDAWKAGQKPTDLATRSPPVVASEPHWEAGYRLEKYEIKEPPVNDGMNLHFNVKLTATTPQGKWEQRDVTYIVGTSPVVTIAFKPE